MTELYFNQQSIDAKKQSRMMNKAKKLLRSVHLKMNLDRFEELDLEHK